jgi:hypothetical protein
MCENCDVATGSIHATTESKGRERNGREGRDTPTDRYEPPRIEPLGERCVETRSGCFLGKGRGGHDAWAG